MIGGITPVLENLFVVKKRDIHPVLDYNETSIKVDARILLTITIGRALGLLLTAGLKFLKIMKDNKKAVQKHDRIGNQDVVSTVLQSDIDTIRMTSEALDRSEMEAAVQSILSAKNIYIVGVRSSAAIASFLNFYFRNIFDNVHLISSTATSEMFEQMLHISSVDVLIGISLPRYSSRTVKVMVSQTTSTQNLWESCCEIAKKVCTNCEIFDTICNATEMRQKEASELSQRCDAMIVVGDTRSSNTGRLAMICRQYCGTVVLVDHVAHGARRPVVSAGIFSNSRYCLWNAARCAYGDPER